jgi:hypothetical protein
MEHKKLCRMCRRFRILAVVARESLCLVADTSLSGLRVARKLTAVIAHRCFVSVTTAQN